MPDRNLTRGYYAAAPTIFVDGQRQPVLGDEVVQSVIVEETTLGLFRCEANFLNWGPGVNDVGYLLFDGRILDFGKIVSIQFGPPGNSGPVFAGRISAIESNYPSNRPPEIVILAEDRFQDLRMERRTRSFEEVTDEDVIRHIASEHGLTAEVDLEGPRYRALAQVNQSDLAFLRERVAAIDAEIWIDNRTLYAQARSRRNAGTVAFTYGQNLLEFTVLADLSHQRSSVSVSGWDVAQKSVIDARADASTIASELAGGRGGSAVLAGALSERNERIVSSVPLSSREAQQMAEARYRARARRFLRGTGVVDGNVGIRVGAAVDLQGLGTPFDGPYYVICARHSFDVRDGYRTTFDVERPAIGA